MKSVFSIQRYITYIRRASISRPNSTVCNPRPIYCSSRSPSLLSSCPTTRNRQITYHTLLHPCAVHPSASALHFAPSKNRGSAQQQPWRTIYRSLSRLHSKYNDHSSQHLVVVQFPSPRVTNSQLGLTRTENWVKQTNPCAYPPCSSRASERASSATDGGSVVTSSSYLLYRVPHPTLAAATTTAGGVGMLTPPLLRSGLCWCVVVEDEMRWSFLWWHRIFTRGAAVLQKYSEFGSIVECGLETLLERHF